MREHVGVGRLDVAGADGRPSADDAGGIGEHGEPLQVVRYSAAEPAYLFRRPLAEAHSRGPEPPGQEREHDAVGQGPDPHLVQLPVQRRPGVVRDALHHGRGRAREYVRDVRLVLR